MTAYNLNYLISQSNINTEPLIVETNKEFSKTTAEVGKSGVLNIVTHSPLTFHTLTVFSSAPPTDIFKRVKLLC